MYYVFVQRLIFGNFLTVIFQSHILLPKERNAYVNFMRFSVGVNVISGGSPSWIRIVRRISFGITIRPRSSILLTIPVAFIFIFLSEKSPHSDKMCHCTKTFPQNLNLFSLYSKSRENSRRGADGEFYLYSRDDTVFRIALLFTKVLFAISRNLSNKYYGK